MLDDPTAAEIFKLDINQQFSQVQFSNALDNVKDPDTLRQAAKLLLEAYFRQRAATQWVMRQHLDATWGNRADIMNRDKRANND